VRAFRYRLKAALAQAGHAEQALQLELARRERELEQVNRRCDALRQAQAALWARLRGVLDGSANRGELVARLLPHELQAELERVEAMLEQVRRLRETAEHGVGETRGRLLEAARSRRKFENHRDRLSRDHRHSELLKETKHLDEVGAAPRNRLPGGAMR